MLTFGWLLLASYPALAQVPSYHPVIADARTRAALPAATIQADGQTLHPDETGRLMLPAAPARLRISHMGYQPQQWQPAPTADTLWLQPQAVALPAVRVRAQPGALVWRYAGKSRWPHDAYARSFLPGEQVAVFYRSADTTRQYRIRAVRVRLGHRTPNSLREAFGERRFFESGRLRVSLVVPGPDGSPVAPSLVPPWVIDPQQSEANDDGWLRLALPADAPLLVPSQGIFVVAAGLADTEGAPVRLRTLAYQRHHPEAAPEYNPKQAPKGSTRVNLYVETPAGADDPPKLARLDSYPAVAQRTANSDTACYSWLYRGKRWQSLPAYCADMRQRMPGQDFPPYNYELVLEVDEL